MLLTNHHNEIGQFWKKFCQWFSNANSLWMWLRCPRDLGKKMLSLTLKKRKFNVKFNIEKKYSTLNLMQLGQEDIAKWWLYLRLWNFVQATNTHRSTRRNFVCSSAWLVWSAKFARKPLARLCRWKKWNRVKLFQKIQKVLCLIFSKKLLFFLLKLLFA